MNETVTIKVPAGYASGAEFAKDCGFEIVQPEPLPWDAGSNRHHEPVETLASEIYANFPDRPGNAPSWVPHGNSQKQDEARRMARLRLRLAGHQP